MNRSSSAGSGRPCFVMGEAAGLAAGLALSAGVAGGAVDVTALQRKLTDHGAYLGQTPPEAIL